MSDAPPADTLVRSGPRRLGQSGIEVGPLAYGLWRFTDPDLANARRIIETALDAGMNMIDTADVYGLDWGGAGFGAAEELLGKVLADAPGLRDRMVLSTKGGIVPPTPYDSSPAMLRQAVDASLRRLGVDVIDLWQVHRPDLYAHPAEVAATLAELRDAGKIREVGVSNHTPAQTDALVAHLHFPLATDQPQFSAAHLDPLRDGTLDRCLQRGTVPLAWSPLAGGRLAPGAEPTEAGPRAELLTTLDRIAEREGVDRSIVALGFVLAHPSAPVAIVGTQTPERITASMAALRLNISRADCYDIIQASEGVPLP